MLVVGADDLEQEVERAGGEDEVVDLGNRGESVGDGVDVTLGLDADHRLAVEAQRERVGHGDYLHDVVLDQALNALANRGLRQTDVACELRVGATAVFLETLDDRLVGGVERARRPGSLSG